MLGESTRWATPYHVVDSGKPGPRVAIVGGCHGNEPAGANKALAWFRTEVAKFGSPKRIMIDSPAIVSGRCRKGRIVCISPHPEQTRTMEHWIRRAVLSVTARESRG